MSTYRLFLIPILFALISLNQAHAVTTCDAFYANKTIEQLVAEKFQLHMIKDARSSPLLALDRFIETEIKPMMLRYDQQLEIAGREGIDSALTSKFRVLEAALTAAQTALGDLQSRYELEKTGQSPKGRGWKIWKPKTTEVPTNELINGFKRCRTGLIQCTSDLESAINNASENFVAIERLIEDFKQFSQILEGIVAGLPQNPNKDFMLQIVSQKANKILGSISTLEVSANLERTRTVLALNLLRSEVPEFTERVEIALAKMRGSEKFKDLDKAELNAAELKTDSTLNEGQIKGNAYLNAILEKNNPEHAVKILNQLYETASIKGAVKIFTPAEAIFLLKSSNINTYVELTKPFAMGKLLPHDHHKYNLKLMTADVRKIMVLQVLEMTKNQPQAIVGSAASIQNKFENQMLVAEATKILAVSYKFVDYGSLKNSTSVADYIEEKYQKLLNAEVGRFIF